MAKQVRMHAGNTRPLAQAFDGQGYGVCREPCAVRGDEQCVRLLLGEGFAQDEVFPQRPLGGWGKGDKAFLLALAHHPRLILIPFLGV